MENFTSLHVTLEVNYIKVSGRLVVGWQNLPFRGKLRIRLRGDYSTPPYPVHDGAPLGAKFIGKVLFVFNSCYRNDLYSVVDN